MCHDNDERSPSIHAIRKRLANDASLVQALEDKYARNNREMFDEAALRTEFRNIWKRFERPLTRCSAGASLAATRRFATS